MNNNYDIFLDGTKIGITALEKADAPMGVVFGTIVFNDPALSFYDLIRKYCIANNITFTDDEEDKFITTYNIPNLLVINKNGLSIKGQSTYIDGMELYGFEINIVGIAYPLYEQEFSHHVDAYKNRFSNLS